MHYIQEKSTPIEERARRQAKLVAERHAIINRIKLAAHFGSIPPAEEELFRDLTTAIARFA